MKIIDIEKIVSEKGVPCVSIIIPMQNLRADKTKGIKAIQVAKELLEEKRKKTNKDVNELINCIDNLVAQIEYTNTESGIGIYVSAHVSEMILFPFEVEEKVIVNDSFDIKDLLYYQGLMFDYCVLSISKKYLHLYQGNGEQLTEIKNEDFPMAFEDSYEYEKPSRASSFGSNLVKEYEKDKSVMQEIRLVDFLKDADHLMKKYIQEGTPLLVSGGTKELADYMSITEYGKQIIAKISGNYQFNGDAQLGSLAWQQIKAYVKKENKQLVDDITELAGKDMVASGLKEVWNAAIEGKGLKLVVEKGFEKAGYISLDGNDLKLRKTVGNRKYSHVNDVVEKIIRLVNEKRGKIILVENGVLEKFDRIALELRYNYHSE